MPGTSHPSSSKASEASSADPMEASGGVIALPVILFASLTGQGAPAPEASGAAPIPHHSPTGALLRSSIVPGWGQFYNGKYLKGVALGVAETGFLTLLILENSAANEARVDFLESGSPGDEAHYQTHRQSRLDLIWYTSAAWLYGMLDAYVDAHLFSFEIQNQRFDGDAGVAAGIVVRF
jgi:hypothetical protein